MDEQDQINAANGHNARANDGNDPNIDNHQVNEDNAQANAVANALNEANARNIPVNFPAQNHAQNFNNPQGVPPALRNWEAFCHALYGYRPTLPEFHGRIHEDPARYLQRCEEYITAFQLPPSQRTKVIEKGLRGDAEKWWQTYKALDFEWPRYRELLTDRFNSRTVKSELTTSLYSKKQGEKESVGAFLQEKYLLFQRVQPNEPEEQKVQLLLNLIKPSLRKALRPMNIEDFASLMTKALQAEKDDNDEHQAKAPKTTPPSRDEKSGSSSKPSSGKPAAPNNEPYLPKCWHCPGRHYNRDCEVYKAQQKGRSENWRQASATPATGAANNNEGRRSATPTAPHPDSHK